MTAIATSEVRRRAIEAYRSGQGTQRSIAMMFGITPRAFRKWWKAFIEENRTAPLPRGHNPAAFSGENLTALDQHVKAHPDATLEELQEAFADRVPCSDVTIHNTLKRLGWRYKKSGYERVSKTDPT
jgi:transposase